MEEKSYHHGNLRNSLIEKGLEIIHEEGEEHLSLRKVAEKCGVSNAAPYAHFKNKEEFIAAIQQYVINIFSDALEESVRKNAGTPDVFSELGKTYVMFFYKNPLYFDILFSRKNIKINLSLNYDGVNEIRPLKVLQNTALQVLGKKNMPQQVIEKKIIAMWALVQGLSCIALMPSDETEEQWEKKVEEVLKSISLGNRE